jgi:CDP-diacylglycerol--serine O-phosphatidyltransferase
MVSTWRFWSGKEINLTKRHPFQMLFMLSIVLYVTLRYSQGVFFTGALIYMFSGIWARAVYSWQRRRRVPLGGAPDVQGAGRSEPDPATHP